MQSTASKMTGWMTHKLESRLWGEILTTSDIQMMTAVIAESEGMGLTKVMASSPITSWQRNGETMRTETDFIFLGSKINADGDCSHEIKICLFLGRKL